MSYYASQNVSKKSILSVLFGCAFLIAFISFITVPCAFAAVVAKKTTPVKIVTSKRAVVLPKVVSKKGESYLKIPKIKVNTVIKDMGLTKEGAMAIPSNRIDVGWFSLGTRPGETGSAVVGGHNRWDNGAGVFDHLDQLKKGDVLSVTDTKGNSTSFVVREMRTYDQSDLNSGIFESESGIHLNLITCSGVWDPSQKTYTTRLVIFTDIAYTVPISEPVKIALNQ